MKKFIFFVLLFAMVSLSAEAAVMNFSQAFAQSKSKPMMILIYAQWAPNYQGCLNNFRALQNEYGASYNYVEMDIAKKDTLNFNKKFSINPNLPYVLMFKSGGQIQRYLDNGCTNDYSCLKNRAREFVK